MKRTAIVVVLAVASLALIFAANAHFITGPTVSTNSTSLTVSGSIAGLGNQDVTIRLNAVANTTCTNKGGNPPPGQAENINATLSGLHPENGRLNFSITATASNPCPDGMRPAATFSNISITVIQGGRVVLTSNL